MQTPEVISPSRLDSARKYLGALRQAEALGLSLRVRARVQQQLELVASEPLRDDYLQALLHTWAQASGWRERLPCLATALQVLGREKSPPKFRAWITAELVALGSWFPLEGEALAELTSLLCLHGQLAAQLPGYWEFYRQQITRFHGPFIESTLWGGFLGAVPPSPATEQHYYEGIAKLHVFLARPASGEETLLWEAGSAISAAKLPELPDWTLLLAWAEGICEQSAFYQEQERRKIRWQLRLAHPSARISLATAQGYLEEVYPANPHSLARLLDLATHRDTSKGVEAALELQVRLRRAESSHLTNADLLHLWQLANAEGQVDLAWRVVTLAERRGLLGEYLHCLWEISGEYRQNYPSFSANPDKHFIPWTSGCAPDKTALLKAFTIVGSSLPYLARVSLGLSISRPSLLSFPGVKTDKTRSLLTRFEHPQWRNYRYQASATANLGKKTAAASAELFPWPVQAYQSNWRGVLEQVLSILGFPAWQWRISKLQEALSSFRGKRRPRWQQFYQELFASHEQGAVKWLTSLSAEERHAWHQLQHLTSTLGPADEEELQNSLFCFACRVATMVYPHHQQALISLQAMEVPLPCLWDFEVWIVSPAYSRWREEMQLSAELSIPEYLHGGW